jgi:RimK-like ATP-grasp domain
MNPTVEPILILSSVVELCTQRVAQELDALGVEFLIVNHEEAALQFSWTVQQNAELSNFDYEIQDRDGKRWNRFSAVWFRRWGFPIYPASFDRVTSAFCYSELTSFIYAFPHLNIHRWINPIDSERTASNKIFQLQLAKQLGLRVPRTLVTSNPEHVQSFHQAYPSVVFKPLSATSIPYYFSNRKVQEYFATNYPKMEFDFGEEPSKMMIFTQDLRDDHLNKLSALSWAPAIFQEKIQKLADIRVTVVGNEIFACRIDSQGNPETSTDFRKMADTTSVQHSTTDLPKELKAIILKMMRFLRLEFGCFDFALEQGSEDYVFFEVNPSGQWLWIEDVTEVNISASIAQLLAFGRA